MADVHALTRTSPKGGPFIGTCMKCGTENLSLAQMHQPCANPANLTQDEALLMAVKGPASGIEAGTDETRSGSAEGESPAPKEDAQP